LTRWLLGGLQRGVQEDTVSRAPERLTPEVIERLAPYVDRAALTAFRARTVMPWTWLPRALRAGAVTLGANVSFRTGSFDPTTPRGLALIAHECVHIRQYRELGMLRFLLSYGRHALAVRGDHDSHPMEVEAQALQARVRSELGQMPTE
jgi:hypothetical protein